MPIIENHRLANDPWQHLDETASLDGRSMVIVPLARLEEALAAWPKGHRGLGVDLPNSARVDDIVPHLARLDIVTVNLPAFNDGRAFSQARSLRHTHRFSGTIRARGNFIPDQYPLLLQAGVDSFEVSARFTIEEWVAEAQAVPATYQRDYAAGAGLATRPFAEPQSWAEQPHYG